MLKTKERAIETYPKNILVINLKYLGDLIVCTPALRALRKSFPDSKIVLLARNEYKSVLDGNPNIDEIISFDSSIKKLRGVHRLFEEFRFVKMLRNRKFDAVISMQSGDRYAQWAYLSSASVRVAPSKQNMKFLINRKVDVSEDSISYREYYLKIAEAAGAVRDNERTEYYIDYKLKSWGEDFFKTNSIYDANEIIAVHPGASEPTKIWPFQNFKTVIEKLIENENRIVLLLLGPAELNKFSKENYDWNNRVIICDTSDNVHKLGWLIAKSKLLIANDSGARHLSAAIGINTISLFPEDKTAPWKFYSEYEKHFFLVGERNSDDPANPFLDKINTQTVIQKALEILNNEK